MQAAVPQAVQAPAVAGDTSLADLSLRTDAWVHGLCAIAERKGGDHPRCIL